MGDAPIRIPEKFSTAPRRTPRGVLDRIAMVSAKPFVGQIADRLPICGGLVIRLRDAAASQQVFAAHARKVRPLYIPTRGPFGAPTMVVACRIDT